MTPPDPAYLLLAVVLAFVANDIWRFAGALLSARIDEKGLVFGWVKMVATALVAGLVAKLVLNPTGGFALAPGWLRLVAVGFGVAAYAAGRRSLALGVLAGEAVLVAGMSVIGPPDG